jgi:predicted nucleotidyltransferase
LNRKYFQETELSPRDKVAREAAKLLYFGLEKEYKQAKLKAAENLGLKILPSNTEIAIALDKVAQETEGSKRIERLVQMRKQALNILIALSVFCPILIGSVWRGTIRKGSDIDIEAYHETPQEVVEVIKSKSFRILKTEQSNTTEHGIAQTSFHIYVESESKYLVEIVVRPIERAGKKRICDTFGDEIKGLTAKKLEKLLSDNPSKQFIPV